MIVLLAIVVYLVVGCIVAGLAMRFDTSIETGGAI